MMIKKINRRMRCEVQGCHEYAAYGLGPKGIDYPMCEAHFRELVEEGMEVLGINKPEPKVIEVPAEKPKEEAEAKEEYYTCKYCGEKFSKSEMTPQQFMAHSRKCKKEHEAQK